MVGQRAAAGNKKAPVMTGAVGCAGKKGKGYLLVLSMML